MVHVSEMGAPPEGPDAKKPLAERFPKGTKVKVAVLEIDAEHRIRLSRTAVAELEKGSTAEAYLKHKTQHELEQKLLRSAERPMRPRGNGKRPARPPAKPGPQAGAEGLTAGAPPTGEARRERPPKRRDGPPRPPLGKTTGGLGTLGDLLKAKLQQRKG
jgi:predicted RNA-binding protein with RPS1 domain